MLRFFYTWSHYIEFWAKWTRLEVVWGGSKDFLGRRFLPKYDCRNLFNSVSNYDISILNCADCNVKTSRYTSTYKLTLGEFGKKDELVWIAINKSFDHHLIQSKKFLNLDNYLKLGVEIPATTEIATENYKPVTNDKPAAAVKRKNCGDMFSLLQWTQLRMASMICDIGFEDLLASLRSLMDLRSDICICAWDLIAIITMVERTKSYDWVILQWNHFLYCLFPCLQ